MRINPFLVFFFWMCSLSCAFGLLPTTTTCHRTPLSLLQMSPKEDDTLNDSSFMESLRSRMEEVTDKETILPLVVLDSMLPRQVLKISVQNPLLVKLVQTLLSQERGPYFGMMGLAKLVTGEMVHLKTGVEVEVVHYQPSQEEEGRMELELKAGRRFRIVGGDVQTAEGGWTEARVEFLQDNDDDESSLSSRTKAKEFQDLIPAWIKLARGKERQDNQIDNLLNDLGEYPSSSSPSEQAFWVGALINPIPAMGVALEIRPQLLTAKTVEERVDIALEGIQRSIAHMDGSQTLF